MLGQKCEGTFSGMTFAIKIFLGSHFFPGSFGYKI